jgi:hypothetical protein
VLEGVSLDEATTSELRRAVNVARSQLGRSILPCAGYCEWLFVCECGWPGCVEHVELSLDAFETVRASGDGHVLADRHELVRARALQAEARELRDQADALLAQAEQIVRRFNLVRREPSA